MKRCVWLFCGVLAAGAALVAAAEDVRIIEVDGEGAKYWPRWRGPSGQGLVPQGQYVDKWSPQTGVHEVHGAIAAKYGELYGVFGHGYPVTDELGCPDGRGCRRGTRAPACRRAP